MYKLALGAVISLMLVLTPATAAHSHGHGKAKVSKTHKSLAPGKSRAHRGMLAKRVSGAHHNNVIRRTIMVRGKRKVVYQRVIVAEAPPRLSMGDRAGLNLTRDPLDLASSVALVLDQNSSEVLFEKNSTVALPIASITKLMTGLIVVEANQDMNEILTVSEDDVDHEKRTGSRLSVGSKLSRASLLHIALMSSENRAAAALARNYPGGVAGFVEAMNAKARALSMFATRYVDSSGLSSKNVASARDLAKLAKFAYGEPLLRQFSTDPKSVVDAGKKILNYRNTNYLVASPDWDIGLQKTGFINEAGRCLVMQAVIQGRAVIMVFLDSKGKQSRTADAGRVKRWLEASAQPSVLRVPPAATPAPALQTSGVTQGG